MCAEHGDVTRGTRPLLLDQKLQQGMFALAGVQGLDNRRRREPQESFRAHVPQPPQREGDGDVRQDEAADHVGKDLNE